MRNKGRRKRIKPKYLPGATWQDVLDGKPVTTTEGRDATRRPPRMPYQCRDCPNRWSVLVGTPTNARCRLCGGVGDTTT